MSSGRRAPHRKPRFSVVAIARNEAERLPRLLASLADFRNRGGEVVVLDTGSSDGTAEIARKEGCRVALEPRRFNGRLSEEQARRINAAFVREGEGPLVRAGERLFHFARARNFASALARENFQLVVDGGDVVEALDTTFLDRLIRDDDSRRYRFECRVLGPVGWSAEVHDCLYDRRYLRWKGRAHNYLVETTKTTGVEPLLTRDQLLVSHHADLTKPRGYQIAGVALEALVQPGSPRWAYFLGRELASRRCFRSALPILAALDRPGVKPAVRSAGLCLVAHCLSATGGPMDEVQEVLFRAVRRDSTRRDPWVQLARLCLALGNMQGAASFAAAALAIPAQVGMPEMEENLLAGPHAILYWALFWLGRRDEARVHFEICCRLDPDNSVYHEHAKLFEPVAPRRPGS